MLSCRSTSREQRRPEPLLGAAPSRWGAASPALGARVPEDAAMGMMGWSSTSMAARYQWLTDPIRRDLARRLGASRRMGRDLHSRRSDHKEGRLGEARDTPVDAWRDEALLSLPYPCGGRARLRLARFRVLEAAVGLVKLLSVRERLAGGGWKWSAAYLRRHGQPRRGVAGVLLPGEHAVELQ